MQKVPTQTNAVITHAIVSTDIVLFVHTSRGLETVLIDVVNPEYAGKKAFPGGLIRPQENAREAAERVLHDKVGIEAGHTIYLEQLGAYSEVARDVRGRVVSVAFIALTTEGSLSAETRSMLVPLTRAKGLAYDHDDIKKDAQMRLYERFENSTISQKMLPLEFTLAQLHALYEAVLGHTLDKRNFLKKIHSLNVIRESGGEVRGGKHRPAKLYEFVDKKVKQLDIF